MKTSVIYTILSAAWSKRQWTAPVITNKSHWQGPTMEDSGKDLKSMA